MNTTKKTRNISNINHKKTIFNNIERYNQPFLFNKRIKNYLLLNSYHKNNKNSFDSKMEKSAKNMDFNNTCNSQKKIKDGLLNFLRIKKVNSNSPNYSKENSKIINYIEKKITFQSFNFKTPKKHSIDNIVKNIYMKDKIISRILNKNKENTSLSSISSNRNKKTNLKKNNININCANKFYLKINNNNNVLSSNYKIKSKIFQASNLSISLDNILSKTINKNQKKIQPKSFDKNKNFSEKKRKLKNQVSMNLIKKRNIEKKENIARCSYKINLDEKLKKKNIKIGKNKKIFHHYNSRQNKRSSIKSENMTEIMRNLTKSDLCQNNSIKNNKINKYIRKHINGNSINNKNKNIIKSKNSKFLISTKNKNINQKKYIKPTDCSRDNSEVVLDESINVLNNAKIMSENRSTNDKSLNAKKNNYIKRKIDLTPNIIINKYKKTYNNENKCHIKIANNNMDNDEFFTYEFDFENEQTNKINGVKTNNFDVKKPKEENLKFTFIKDDIESDLSVSQASKIVIGKIDGYKDIIENDIKNYENKHLTNKSILYNQKSNIFNNTNRLEDEIGENPSITMNKKISNISTLLKKESEPITFKDDNFYDSFNMTNLDGVSSKITNNIINDNKKVQQNSDINDNYFKSQNRKNNISIFSNIDNNIDDVNIRNDYNFDKNDNFGYSLNKNFNNINNNKELKAYNNNINNECKNNILEKINDINKNCIII